MQEWNRFQNFISEATDNSFRMAFQISTFHYNALDANKADPLILPLYTSYKPVQESFENVLTAYTSQTGIQQGGTLNLNQFLRLLSGTKAKKWDTATQQVYPDTTPEYKALFPNHRFPFQNGGQEDRIKAIKALSDAIGSDVSLAAVKTDVDGFYTQIKKAFDDQKAGLSTTTTASDNVETERVIMSDEQFGNYGELIKIYKNNPLLAKKFFDEQRIRFAQQVVFTNSVKKLSSHFIVKHTFGVTDQLEIINSGDTELQFYLAAQKIDLPGGLFVTAHPHTTQIVLASACGPLTNSLLMVYNPDTINKGKFTIEML